jgi:proline dehydrogenase
MIPLRTSILASLSLHIRSGDGEGVVASIQATASFRERLQHSTNAIFRKGILVATNNGALRRFVRRYGMKLGAARFVAGETLDECIVVLKELNARGLRTNTTILGEGVRDEATANRVVESYIRVLDRIASERIDGNVALKLTHRNLERLVAHAATRGGFIRIDMEESGRVDATLRLYRRLREAGHDNVGMVLQSYLYRTEGDLADLLPLTPNLRLVKGAYLEPDSVAYPKKTDVDAAYVRLADRMLAAGGFTAIATHDERIIDHVIAVANRDGIPHDRFEFQMLYGIRPQLQVDLAKRGYRVLVATPHGPDWYHYLMRRLAERPANLLWFAKNLLRR